MRDLLADLSPSSTSLVLMDPVSGVRVVVEILSRKSGSEPVSSGRARREDSVRFTLKRVLVWSWGVSLDWV